MFRATLSLCKQQKQDNNDCVLGATGAKTIFFFLSLEARHSI